MLSKVCSCHASPPTADRLATTSGSGACALPDTHITIANCTLLTRADAGPCWRTRGSVVQDSFESSLAISSRVLEGAGCFIIAQLLCHVGNVQLHLLTRPVSDRRSCHADACCDAHACMHACRSQLPLAAERCLAGAVPSQEGVECWQHVPGFCQMHTSHRHGAQSITW